MCSMVWDFFERPDLPVDYVPCPKCDQLLAYKGTTSGLKKHLKAKHFPDFQRIMAQKGVTSTSNSDFHHSELFLARSFCTGQIPFDFASNPEFRIFCQSLNYEFRVPNPQKIREILVNNILSFKENTQHNLINAKNYVIITDGFSDSTIFSVHVAFVDPYTFERKVLLCGITSDIGNTRCLTEIKTMVENVGLKFDNKQSIIADITYNTSSGLNIIPCAGHMISQIFDKFSDRVENLVEVHQDVKNIYEIIKEHEESIDLAKSLQKDYNITTPLPLNPSNTPKWASLYTDTKAFMANSIYFNHIPCLQNRWEQVFKKCADIEKFLNLLQPLHNVLEALTQEDTFISDIVPNLLCVKEELDESDPDAKILAGLIQEKITFYLSNDQVLLAMISDPRYAYVPNLIEPKTWQEVEQLLAKQESESTTMATSSEILETPKTEDDASRGLAGLLKRKIKSEAVQKNFGSELLHYQALMATNRPCHTSNPLQFWKEQQQNFPKLAQISIRNLTAMASTTLAEKLHRKCSGVLDSKIDEKDLDLYLLGCAIAPNIDKELLEEEIHIPAQMPFMESMDSGIVPGTVTESGSSFEREVKTEPVEQEAVEPMPTVYSQPPQNPYPHEYANAHYNNPCIPSSKRIHSRIAPPLPPARSMNQNQHNPPKVTRPIFYKDHRV